MSDLFNAEEVLEIACQIERNGAGYYRQAAERVSDPAARQMLLDLAAMERDRLPNVASREGGARPREGVWLRVPGRQGENRRPT